MGLLGSGDCGAAGVSHPVSQARVREQAVSQAVPLGFVCEAGVHGEGMLVTGTSRPRRRPWSVGPVCAGAAEQLEEGASPCTRRLRTGTGTP